MRDWKNGEVEPIPGKTMPAVTVVERDYPNTFARFTALGPLMEKLGNNGKGMAWKTEHEVGFLRHLNGEVEVPGVEGKLARMDTDIDACETLMHLAPETNGHVAVKAWEALGKATGRDHRHLALPKEHEAIRFRDVQAQPRKIISSPIWSGLESEDVCYNSGYTNVHELIPWRTLSGRQQLYQDHPWMLAFGEALGLYRPPVDLRAHQALHNARPNGHPEYRTLPMVWYVPPLSPVQSAAEAGHVGWKDGLPDVERLRIPVKYLANLLTAGAEAPVASALQRMMAMRMHMRARTVESRDDTAILARVGMTASQVEAMYQTLAIANYEDRYVIPSTHREYAENAFDLKSSCGFSFGQGCYDGRTVGNLFSATGPSAGRMAPPAIRAANEAAAAAATQETGR